ncbi:Kinesin-like protein kif22, partial [Coemansia interrupta]
HIFMHKQRDPFDYDIRVSYYEIYKEAVFDLFKPRDSSGGSGLPIREDANHKIFVAGLSEKRVTSYEQFDAMYQRACGNRRTASTKLNNHSSRSHAILTVQVQWKDDIGTGKTWCGRLHLIDLAGSEDNRRTENGRDRMAESSAINRSLFVLGQVVEALNTGASRIPYRDSKMTRILQDSLGGDSQGMMIVNVSPGEAFLQDTHNTLNFATKSREVVNKPVAHEVVEQRWSAADRLQHHRGAGRAVRSAVVAAGTVAAKRRRSEDAGGSDTDGSPAHGDGPGSAGSLNGTAGSRRRASPAVPPSRLSDNAPRRPPLAGHPQPQQADFVQKVVHAKFTEMSQRSESASNQIMERVMRIEKQLSGAQLDSSAVIDLFTPATKLKTSRGWLKHARELEQKGELERALAHYEEALRYCPELNKLEAHIAKLKARIRRQKRRSSLASHGEANVRVADQTRKPDAGAADEEEEEDVGPLWLVDGLAESPGAEKAKRRALASKAAPPAAAEANGAKKKANGVPKPAPKASGQALFGSKDQPANAAAAKPGTKRVKLGDASKKNALAALTGKSQFVSITEGSVHDNHRLSFGTSSHNPFVVGGDEFQSDLQDRIERKNATQATLRAAKLDSKSSAAARLRRVLQEPVTPDDRRDRDYVLSDRDGSDEDFEADGLVRGKKGRAKGRRAGRVPGSLGVRGLLEKRLSEGSEGARPERLSDVSAKSKASPGASEERLDLAQFNEICLASAVQMINSGEVKKIMKLQGIGKRRAEQIQASVQSVGPIVHISDLKHRLQFKNKLILDILSTFA